MSLLLVEMELLTNYNYGYTVHVSQLQVYNYAGQLQTYQFAAGDLGIM